jgi:hypothetical protein
VTPPKESESVRSPAVRLLEFLGMKLLEDGPGSLCFLEVTQSQLDL